jgi:hypothetical protein
VRLYVGILSPEELAYTVDGELLYFVNYLTAAIVAMARVAFGILVSEV